MSTDSSDEQPSPRARWLKTVGTIAVPVIIAVFVTAISPLGDRLKELFFPTSAAARGVISLNGAPLSGAAIVVDDDRQGVSSSDGSFLLTGLGDGGHTIGVDAVGARHHESSFFVGRGDEETDIGTIDLSPSVVLAGDLRIAFTGTAVAYDVGVWLEGDEEALSRIARATYSIAMAPATSLTSELAIAKFCVQAAGSLARPEVPRGAVDVLVEFVEGARLRLRVPEIQQFSLGSRPAGCGGSPAPPPDAAPTTAEPTPPPAPPPAPTAPKPTSATPTGSETTTTEPAPPEPVTIRCSPSGGLSADADATVGAEVRWLNDGDEPMVLDFASNALPEPNGEVAPGTSYILVPENVGEYLYTCVFSQMKQSGTLRITDQ